MIDENKTIAVFVNEQVLDPQKVKVTHVENTPGLHFVRFNACLQTYDTWNRNNRNYHLAPMKKSWAAPHIQELLRRKDLFGENGHPMSDDPKRIVTIDPKVSCHRINSISFKGNAVFGEIETLNDDLYGKQFMMHILQGCEAAFSLRALVPLTKIDAVRSEIRQPGHIITVDRVILPSHKEAYQVPGDVELVVSDKPLMESYTPNISENIYVPEGQSNEDSTVEVTESAEWINYLTDENENLKNIINNFEISTESAHYDSNTNNVIIREKPDKNGSRRTAIVKMNDYVKQEVSDMLIRF